MLLSTAKVVVVGKMQSYADDSNDVVLAVMLLLLLLLLPRPQKHKQGIVFSSEKPAKKCF